MAIRLVPLDEGSEIVLDRAMVVAGRHPSCDARLDSLRVSRHHCCMIQENGEVFVRDLGSTNGIRINSQRVESGRLRPGDELSIAHIRYRLDDGRLHESTLAESLSPNRLLSRSAIAVGLNEPSTPIVDPSPPPSFSKSDGNALADAVRRLLPPDIADKCKIQVIVEMASERDSIEIRDLPVVVTGNHVPETGTACPSDSCL